MRDDTEREEAIETVEGVLRSEQYPWFRARLALDYKMDLCDSKLLRVRAKYVDLARFPGILVDVVSRLADPKTDLAESRGYAHL